MNEKSFYWYSNRDSKPEKNHSVLMLTTHGVAEGEWKGDYWLQYRWSSKLQDNEVLYWTSLSNLMIKTDE